MIRIIAIGRIKEKSLKDLIAEYAKRLGAYDRLEIVECEEEAAPQKNSAADNEKVKTIEGKRMLEKIGRDDYVILLDLKGKDIDSVRLSEMLDEVRSYRTGTIDFVIGGSLGTSAELQARADFRWKLSSLTFPHQIARLLVLEQVYRAFKILKNEPYHK